MQARIETGSPLSVKIVAGLAVVLSLLAIVVGTVLYQWHFRQERHEVSNTLAAIVDARSRLLTGWLGERAADARAFATNPAHVRDIDACKQSDIHCEGLFGGLSAAVGAYRYRSGAVVGLDGRVLTSAGEDYALHFDDLEMLRRIAAGSSKRICDLHVGQGGKPELEVAAPLVKGGEIVAVVFLVVDAERHFFPLVSHWPLPGAGGEVMLLKADDTDARILSPLSHQSNAGMELRIPLTGDQVAAQAALGATGTITGPDYRGAEVLGIARAIPDTPWVLLAQQDADVVKESVRWSAAATGVITAMFVVMTGSVALIWVVGRLERFRLKEQSRRRLVESQTEWLRRFGNDIVLLVDEQGLVVDANDRAEKAFGYTRDELLQMSIHDIRSVRSDMRHSPLDLDAGKGEGQVFRTWHRRKDGTEFPVEVSLRALVVDGRRMYQDIIRDITDRLAAEEVINRQARMFSALSQTNKVVLRVHDRQVLLDELCDCAVRLGGFRGAWVAMRTDFDNGALDIASLRGDLGGWPGVLRLTLDPDDPYGRSATADAIREEKPQCRRDIQSDPNLGAWHELIVSMGLRAVAAFPVRECGEVCGAFTVFSQDNEIFTPETLALLAEMADDLSFGLDFLLRENWRRIAEESLRQSEVRYRALVEDHPGMLCRFLADGTLTFVNDAYCRVFGKPAHQLLGSSFYDLIPAEDVEFARSQVAMLGPDHPTETYTHRAIGDGGKIRWQEWTDRALLDSDGRVVEYQSAGKDITDRIEMEQALRDSQEFLAAMAAATRDAIIVMDDHGRVTFWNASAQAILGYSQDEALGRPVHSLIGSKDEEHSFLANMVRFRETGTGAVIGRTLELQATNKSGETFPVELSVNAFRLKGNWHAVGVLRDIRDRKEMELRA
ncbi:PAS domain S-box protein, partial [Magnetospirillum sp. LM-5]|uniref:PAS domain S-box protein n=1 Tax=Magnetospirillum sp. LM-5 TaxID=2681466 RepID=UPI00157005EB